ncbi:MAG: S8 family serine peptidase [Myxococcota bacterium]
MIDENTEVAFRGRVERVVRTAQEHGLKQVRALVHSHEARKTFEVSGQGQTVAVLDSGIMSGHYDFLTPQGQRRIRAAVDFTEAGSPWDETGHGSHVAGIIAANGVNQGIAPDAEIVSLRVLCPGQLDTFGPIRRALEWVVERHESFGITAVCMSLADDGNYRSEEEAGDQSGITDLIHHLYACDIPVCISTGNRYGTFREQGMAFPAIIRRSISVGAVYDDDIGRTVHWEEGTITRTTGPDRVASFSQRLHSSTGGEHFTTLLAPAARVTSTGIGDPRATASMDGTSQAAPVVAGVVLLLQEYLRRKSGARPTVDQLKTWLRAGAKEIFDGDDEAPSVPATHQTYLRVDARGALEAAAKEA